MLKSTNRSQKSVNIFTFLLNDRLAWGRGGNRDRRGEAWDDRLSRLITAVLIRTLRPLVRITLRLGVPYHAFAEALKWVHVDVGGSPLPHSREETDAIKDFRDYRPVKG